MSMVPTATERSPWPPGFSFCIMVAQMRSGSRLSPESFRSVSGSASSRRGSKALADEAALAVAAVGVEAVADHRLAVADDIGDHGDQRTGHFGEIDVRVGDRGCDGKVTSRMSTMRMGHSLILRSNSLTTITQNEGAANAPRGAWIRGRAKYICRFGLVCHQSDGAEQARGWRHRGPPRPPRAPAAGGAAGAAAEVAAPGAAPACGRRRGTCGRCARSGGSRRRKTSSGCGSGRGCGRRRSACSAAPTGCSVDLDLRSFEPGFRSAVTSQR